MVCPSVLSIASFMNLWYDQFGCLVLSLQAPLVISCRKTVGFDMVYSYSFLIGRLSVSTTGLCRVALRTAVVAVA